jgi:hypothetical protein
MKISMRLWARFTAKIALAVASQGASESWLDTERGRELRAFVRDDQLPPTLWPDGAPLARPLANDDPVALVLKRHQHLLCVLSVDGEAVVGLILFGSFATAVPLGIRLRSGEVAWLLDHTLPPPQPQPYARLIAELASQSDRDR